MQASELAGWIKAEHVKVEELADKLRERIALPPRSEHGRWLADVKDRFEHFRAHMLQHMALEEREGYMHAVLARRPGLEPRVERLRREHAALVRLLDRAHRALEELNPRDHLLVRDFCHRAADILNFIEHHEDEENELVEFVFTDDIGTKD